MFRSAWVLTGLVALAATGNDLRAEDDALKQLQAAIQQAIKKAEPSIACILVSRSEKYGTPQADDPGKLGDLGARRDSNPGRFDMADADYVPESYGSGVVIDARDRLILTNYHVVRDATKLFVRLPGERGSYADIHAADPRSDLAVLQLVDRAIVPREIRLGDGAKADKGQFIVALSHPFAVGFRDGSPSASWGIISNIRRPVPSTLKEDERSKFTLAQFGRLLQYDAKVSLGCSGGALLNLKGEMIGITNSLAALTGVETPGGFALPMDDNVRAIIDVLKRGEEVEYGFLGVRLQIGNDKGDFYKIANAIGNSPAAAANLYLRPYILSINGVPIHDSNDLFFNIGIALAGSTVKLEVTSDPRDPSETRVVPVKLVKSFVPGKVIAAKRPDARKYGGLRVDYASVLIQHKSFPSHASAIPNGVGIREVLPKSAAAEALLQEDKVITHVNGQAVNHPTEFYKEMDAARQAGKTVELTVMNVGDQPYKVKLDLR
jgi:S1-C subfamily serine protease